MPTNIPTVMKKIILPALIIAASVLVAGFVVALPVQKATAVHTTILASTQEVREVVGTDTDVDDPDDLTLTCDEPFVVHALYSDITGTTGADDPGVAITVTPIDALAAFQEGFGDNIGGGDDELLTQDFASGDTVTAVPVEDDGEVDLEFDETADAGNEDLDVTAIIQVNAGATCSFT